MECVPIWANTEDPGKSTQEKLGVVQQIIRMQEKLHLTGQFDTCK